MTKLDQILTDRWPFGPIDAGLVEDAVKTGVPGANELFDRTNLVYAQTINHSRPAYIVGRKGAGKTAFLLSSTLHGGPPTEEIQTDKIYHEMDNVLRRYQQSRGQLFVKQAADIWLALFDQLAMFHAYRTASSRDSHDDLQMLWDYLGHFDGMTEDSTRVAERYLADLRRRIADESLIGLDEVLHGHERNGVSVTRARKAMEAILKARRQPLIIVMDNLEDLHKRLHTLQDVLSGMFAAVGKVIASNHDDRPYGLQICLPSELFDQLHAISAAPVKDFRGSYLKIYWTASELLKLAGTRLQLYLRAHCPDRLDTLRRAADRLNEPEPAIALLRAALPDNMVNGFGMREKPVAYLLRHTQLLPRQLIEILNYVFTARDKGSTPWAVTPEAVLSGTRTAEDLIVKDILAAHFGPYPYAREALNKLSNRLDICFPARQLHKVFNQEGIAKITGLDFDDFLTMLFTLGVVGVWFDRTERYNKAHFQYTFDTILNADEGSDNLCFHPLFTLDLNRRTLPRLREAKTLVTYPQGCDPVDADYRISLGYVDMSRRP